ncbi:hypothetical protein F5051DRAFT_468064 [Lentinula edodes]|nr:hypothetical protein F5051DRAFT_468064 [Lentinula edodes]
MASLDTTPNPFTKKETLLEANEPDAVASPMLLSKMTMRDCERESYMESDEEEVESQMSEEEGGNLSFREEGETLEEVSRVTPLVTVLTKLGYLIDNPLSNALDRARAAGLVLASVLRSRQLGVRPITLIGFSLGARAIFYVLVELAKSGGYGNVNTVAGLRPIEGVQGLEDVDVTDKIAGHISYRVYMPVILEELGFKVTERWFDEVEEPDFEDDRVVLPSSTSPSSHPSTTTSSTNPSTSTNPDTDSNLSWFTRRKAKTAAQKEREQRRKEAEQRQSVPGVQRPPSYSFRRGKGGTHHLYQRVRLHLRPSSVVGSPLIRVIPHPHSLQTSYSTSTSTSTTSTSPATPLPPLSSDHIASTLPETAGFDFAAIKAELAELESMSMSMPMTETTVGGVGPQSTAVLVPAVEAPRMRVRYRVDNEEGIEEIEEEFGPSSSSSPPPTPPSKSPNAGYLFPPTTSNTTGLTFGSADGKRITPSSGIGLPDPYIPDPWVQGAEDMGRSGRRMWGIRGDDT